PPRLVQAAHRVHRGKDRVGAAEEALERFRGRGGPGGGGEAEREGEDGGGGPTRGHTKKGEGGARRSLSFFRRGLPGRPRALRHASAYPMLPSCRPNRLVSPSLGCSPASNATSGCGGRCTNLLPRSSCPTSTPRPTSTTAREWVRRRAATFRAASSSSCRIGPMRSVSPPPGRR